jgi:F-type H+-transporting ATPase subunit epsilon
MAEHAAKGDGGLQLGGSADARVLTQSPLQLIVVTPEATVLDKQVNFVALPLFDGEIGIAPGRAPMIGRLGYGELRIERDRSAERYYVDGGFVQVAGNVVSVLTSRAVPAAAIDAAKATEQLAAARARKANGDELLELRDRLEQQARAQIRVSSRAH